MRKALREYFEKAKKEHWAIGHFNFSTGDQLKAIVEAAAECKSPVMVATSEGETKFVGRQQAVALVRSWQELGYPVWLNADHHKSFDAIEEAVDEGYDTVLIDASKLPYKENVALTKKVVEFAKMKDPLYMVEGELGYLKGDSKIETKVEISPADYTKPEQAKEFVMKTGIDRLAIVFGNIHGIVTEQEERLDIGRLKTVAAAVPDTYLVLHGASGLPDEDIREAIKHGITNVHINTEIRVAYHDALEKELAKADESTTPYTFMAPAVEATKELVRHKLKLFGSVGKV
jgi:fructose-bisphosphate aldolase class II